MATITEDYVSFETAKLLKDKGFEQNCATYYLDGQVWRHYHGEVIPKGKQIYAAPTQAVAMKWLREVHNIHINLLPFDIEIRKSTRMVRYLPEIYTLPQKGHELDCIGMNVCDSCEKACEAAIKYCLENLI